MNQTILKSWERLFSWVLRENFSGWDIFDGLNSIVFNASPFAKFRLFRLAWIQFFKNSPYNFRSISKVSKGYNPKGLGLFASAFLRLEKFYEAEKLLKRLMDLKCSGYSGSSWGYNFDWQARAFFVPEGKPNIITTVFVANAFLDAYKATGDYKWLETAIEAANFILDNLLLKSRPCFGYIPGDATIVHNANMLGSTLLANIYSHTGENKFVDVSKSTMNYSMQALRKNFSWPYGERSHHRFVDNFHTGFNLVALKDWMDATKDWCWLGELKGAYRYFLDNFWLDNGCPKYYDDKLYPIDIHCSAQGIYTCTKMRDIHSNSIDFAIKIAKWVIENMQDMKGYFYYQKTRWYTNRIPYIRWAQAWMFFALTCLLTTYDNDALSNL